MQQGDIWCADCFWCAESSEACAPQLPPVVVVSAATSDRSLFKCVLYRYASRLPVEPAFDQSELSGTFAPRR